MDFPSLKSYRAILVRGGALCPCVHYPTLDFVCTEFVQAFLMPPRSLWAPYIVPTVAVTRYFRLLQPVSVLYPEPRGEDLDTDIPFRAEHSEVSHSELSLSVSSFWYFLFQLPKARPSCVSCSFTSSLQTNEHSKCLHSNSTKFQKALLMRCFIFELHLYLISLGILGDFKSHCHL